MIKVNLAKEKIDNYKTEFKAVVSNEYTLLKRRATEATSRYQEQFAPVVGKFKTNAMNRFSYLTTRIKGRFGTH